MKKVYYGGIIILVVFIASMAYRTYFIDEWKKAEAKWEEFKQSNFKSARFIEKTDPIISKYLPDFRIYKQDTNRYLTYVFVLNKDGSITNIGSDWTAEETGAYFKNPRYSNFMRLQDIRIDNPVTAIEIIKLTEYIFYEFNRGSEWNYRASRDNNRWVVDIEYIGPPVSIVEPPDWEIEVDDQNRIQEIQFPFK